MQVGLDRFRMNLKMGVEEAGNDRKTQKKLLDLLNLHPVPPDEVMLSPKLLNLRIR